MSDISRAEDPAKGGSPGTSVLFEVFALGQAVHGFLAEAMVGGPLRPEEYALYSAIFEPERITPTALAARLGMPLTTLMDHLARTEARGHAHRFAKPDDRRQSLVTLTANGLAAHREANRAFERAYAALVAELPDGEAAAKATLEQLVSAVRRARTAHAVAGRTDGS